MKNNDTLKNIALQTKELKHLAGKETLTHDEYMQLVCTREWQAEMNGNLDRLRKLDNNWY